MTNKKATIKARANTEIPFGYAQGRLLHSAPVEITFG
jgi:uncharacterized protein (DUF3820 family)